MAILNACKAHGGELVNEVVCKGCKDTGCRHAGELTTAERLYGPLLDGQSAQPGLLLVLDSMAHSAENRLYKLQIPSIAAGMAIVKHLVEENFVSFDYDTACDHKIYIAYISQVNKRDQETRLRSSSDGLSWQ